jgi:hypothetical protein
MAITAGKFWLHYFTALISFCRLSIDIKALKLIKLSSLAILVINRAGYKGNWFFTCSSAHRLKEWLRCDV